MFDDIAGDDVRPAGLRYGIGVSTASESIDPGEAMIADLSGLAATVSVIGGPNVAHCARRAIAISLRAQRELPFPVLGSPAVAPDDVIAIATQGIASATDPVPEISSSRSATVHMDNDPSAISSIGTPNTVAAPTRRCGKPLRLDQTSLQRELGVARPARLGVVVDDGVVSR